MEQLGQYLDDRNTKDDLQEFCREVEQSASGTKAELVKRILAALGEAMAAKNEEFLSSFKDFFFLEVDKATLKEACREAGLAVSGSKLELAKRLAEHLFKPLVEGKAVSPITLGGDDVAQPVEKRARKDGRQLEREFASFLESSLGYTSTKQRVAVPGYVADRSWEIDVFAEKYSRIWDAVRYIGFACLVLTVVAWIFPVELRDVNRTMVRAISLVDRSLSSSAPFIFGVFAFAASFIGKVRTEKRAWAECKSLKSGFKRDHVQKVAGVVKDVRALNGSRYKPHSIYCVSGTYFDQDALNFARENGFTCYQKKGDSFEVVA